MSRTNSILKDDTFTEILQAIDDQVSIIDSDLNIVWANDVAKDRFGNDIIGKKCYHVYHNRTTPCELSFCICKQAFTDGETHEHDTEAIEKNGRKNCFHCTANIGLKDDDGNPRFIIGISRDITELKKAEAENDRLAKKLLDASDKIDTLNGLLRMCSSSKKIRTDEEYWQEVNEYIRDKTKDQFGKSGLCLLKCFKKFHPE